MLLFVMRSIMFKTNEPIGFIFSQMDNQNKTLKYSRLDILIRFKMVSKNAMTTHFTERFCFFIDYTPR